MPVCFIEAPPGIRNEAKKKMVAQITAAIDEAFHIGETLIFLREYSPENVAMDGRLQSENPEILEALKKIRAEAKRPVCRRLLNPRNCRCRKLLCGQPGEG